MASIQLKSQSWYCQFYWQDRRYTYAVGRVTRSQAEAKATRTDEIVELLSRGLTKIPDNCDVVTFVTHDGHPPIAEESQKVQNKTRLVDVFESYIAAHVVALKTNTLNTVKIHQKHLIQTLGTKFDLKKLDLPDLQKHFNRR